MKNIMLTKEIVRHIFGSLGLSASGLNKIGLTSKEFLIDKTVDIEYDDNKIINHKIFANKIRYNEFTIKFLAIDLTIDENIEIVLAIKMSDLPTHIMRLSYSEDSVDFKLSIENKFVEASITVQCQLLLGIEEIISLGLPLETLDDFEDLRLAGLSICQ